MENLWRYYISKDCLSTGGVVFATAGFKALSKILKFYEDENLEAKDIAIWKAVMDDDYSQENPDVLMVY